MRTYESKEMLIEEIKNRYEKYDMEFENIPEDLKDKRIDEVDKTPAENLSYQLGWVNLLLSWDRDELAGKDVKTPAEGYKWNNLGGLYKSFYEEYGKYSIEEQRSLLRKAVNEIYEWVDKLSDKDLFEPEQRKWATTNAKWPIYKWVHINTVAPFTNFRTKIRKWKKLVL